MPGLMNPVQDASELAIANRDSGRITLAGGLASHGEPVRRVRDGRGRATELWLAGGKMVTEAALVREMEGRYGKK